MSALEGGRTVYDAMLESKQYQEALAMYQTVHASHARLVERMREEKKRTHMARVQTRRAELRDTLHARQATAERAAKLAAAGADAKRALAASPATQLRHA